jgi:hypothetical protein
MFGKSKKSSLAGASDKLEAAKKMKDLLRQESLAKQGGPGAQAAAPLIPVTIIFVLSVAFAMLISDDSATLAKLHTGIYYIDHYLLSTSAYITGNADTDKVIMMCGRGLIFFIASGIIPGLTYALSSIINRDRVSPLILCWMIIVVLSLCYTLPLGEIFSSIKDIVSTF